MPPDGLSPGTYVPPVVKRYCTPFTGAFTIVWLNTLVGAPPLAFMPEPGDTPLSTPIAVPPAGAGVPVAGGATTGFVTVPMGGIPVVSSPMPGTGDAFTV